MSSSGNSGRAERDLGRAQVVESSGMQNAVAVGGVAALIMWPIAWLLTVLQRVAAAGRRRLSR